jgi:hypothetical protein
MAPSERWRFVIPCVEKLEIREAPSASPLLVEAFDNTPQGTLPAGWVQWSNTPTASFAVSSARSLSAPNGLAVQAGLSQASVRTWTVTPLPADVDVGAAVYLDTLIPAQILARGSGLDTAAPSYYAVSVTRNLQVQLVRAVGGVTTVLGQLTSARYFEQNWVRATLAVSGATLEAQVLRPDTGQYLNSAGQWQADPAWAVTASDTALAGPGLAGLGRPASYVGSVTFDDFTVAQPMASGTTENESFDTTAVGSLPAGWQQWSSNASPAFSVSSGRALSPPNGLAMTAGVSTVSARAWNSNVALADGQVTAAVYLDTLIPAQVFARGTNLDTANPSYYAVTVTRNLQLQLVRVVGGVTTVLGQLTSAHYFEQDWVRATLSISGSTLQAHVLRPDTGQYLNSAGQWQADPAWALTASDTALTGPGPAGLGRPGSYTGTVTFDDFSVTGPVVVPPSGTESFDTTPPGSLPAAWQQWSSNGSAAFSVSSSRALSPPNGLAVTAVVSNLSARAWNSAISQVDAQVTAAVFLNGLIPAQVFARGTNLDTSTPSYYAVSITRDLQVQLVRVRGGVATVLGQLTSLRYFDQNWVRVTLAVNGATLEAQIFRPDTAQYLNSAGQWQAGPAWALSATETALTGPGFAGLARPASYVGTVTFDDFTVLPGAGDTVPPSVTITVPQAASTVSGVVTVQANATDDVGVTKVAFYIDDALRATVTAPPYRWDFDTSTVFNGSHTVTVLAYDLAGNVGQDAVTVTTSNTTVLYRPTIPQHYPNIRIAELAYNGIPFDGLSDQLLQNSVDLVIDDSAQVSNHVSAVAPATPQLVYTNTSSLYSNLLTDWLNYADANGIAREEAFYHVTQATSFSGTSQSSQPVNWFWAVYRGGAGLHDVTFQARGTNPGGVAFGAAGESVYLGYTDPFREINVALASGPAGGWSGVWEYPTAVDSAGNPTAWAALPLLTDTTSRLSTSGQALFDPPQDWNTASLAGSARLYYVRFRTTAGGTAPVARSLLGRDYVNAHGTTSGVIPAFDYAADTDHDGYLNDAEYARRAPGKDARFVYESRDFAGSYGQMRFATNPADPYFRNWAIDYNRRLLSSFPGGAGLFMDNSSGTTPVNPAVVQEPAASYASSYAGLLNAIALALAPDWVLANTAGGGTTADPVAQKVQGYFEEFGLRPLDSNYLQFEDLALQTFRRTDLTAPAPFVVLDSLPTPGSPDDPRTQLATLASYYLLADPATTFLDFFGGFEPATSWSRHWSPAAAFDIGQPQGRGSVFTTGADPGNPALTYRVYQRSYTNALVLYKPLSFGQNNTGTLDDATATTHALGGTYYPLRADGTLGPAVTSISLRNGEGAILVKAGS